MADVSVPAASGDNVRRQRMRGANMPEPASTYTMGYDEDFLQMLHWRSAETHAKHLLPHLEPGLRMLDFGCGPGTLSVGLARAVEPGEFHGVDIESSQIDMARAAAEAGGHSNASFQVADVTDLPFDDNTFDVAHCHTVLNHVPDTDAVLAEVRRVLKPGGIISCRELIAASSFSEPAYSLAGAWETFTKLVIANGGHPQMGKELKATLLDAGFVDVRATASVDMFSTPRSASRSRRCDHRVVLLSQGDGRRHCLRVGHPGSVRHMEGRPGEVARPSGSAGRHRLRRGHRHQAVTTR